LKDKSVDEKWEFGFIKFKELYKDKDFYGMMEHGNKEINKIIKGPPSVCITEVLYNLEYYYKTKMDFRKQKLNTHNAYMMPYVVAMVTILLALYNISDDVKIGIPFLFVCLILCAIGACAFIFMSNWMIDRITYYEFYYEVVKQFRAEYTPCESAREEKEKSSKNQKKKRKKKK